MIFVIIGFVCLHCFHIYDCDFFYFAISLLSVFDSADDEVGVSRFSLYLSTV